VWDAIPPDWWLSSETCKYMLACLVHKDNKDISSKPTKLPPGRSRKDARKAKDQAVAEERTMAKTQRPISMREHFGDVDLAIKKAKIEGMKSHAEKIAVDAIVSQVNLLRENKAFYEEIHGENQYKMMIVNLLNKLPGIPAPAIPESVSQEGESLAHSAPGSSWKGMEVTILDKDDNLSMSDEGD